MRIMKKILQLIIVLGIIVCSSCIPKNPGLTTTKPNGNKQETPKYKISKVYTSYEQLAPRLTADAKDETIYVVNFWATWCVQCRKEIPEMVKLQERFKNDKKVKILYVNLDEAKRQKLVEPFLEKYEIEGEVVSLTDPDQEKWISAIEKNWNGSLPGTLFFKGNKHRKFYGYPLSYPELERNIGFMRAKK